MTTTVAKPKTKKPVPAQTDVRIVGGKTTVKLRSPGNETLRRMNALLGELHTNAATHPGVSRPVSVLRDAMLDLSLAVGFSGLPEFEVGDPE